MTDQPQTTNEKLIEAFISGAKFWEFHKTGATMWQADQNICLKKAQEKYGESNVKA